jgi:hypothetical protein
MGKHAKVDNLRVFGCLVYVHTQVRSKLDDKAWKGIMVGYDDHNTRCYRIFDPIRRVVVRSVHVTFNENIFPAKVMNAPVSDGDVEVGMPDHDGAAEPVAADKRVEPPMEQKNNAPLRLLQRGF